MVQATVNVTAITANFALVLYADPFGVPSVMAEAQHDANLLTTPSVGRMVGRRFLTPQPLVPNTPYALGLRQLTGVAVSGLQYDVFTPAHFQPNGLGAACYAANSLGGAAFVQQQNALGVSGARRYLIWARVSHLDDGVQTGGGGMIGRSLIAGAA